jgi:hypothetical protein
MAYDMPAPLINPQKRMQLTSSLHLQKKPDGGALIIDDRTLTVAHLNRAAYILLQALCQPRTQEVLIAILAEAANCDTDNAVAPVAQFLDQLTEFGWIETS